MPDTETLIAGLRIWARTHDRHVRAAVELLIWHRYWLIRADFVRACIDYPHLGYAVIRWAAARAFIDAGPRGSTSEVAILDLAVALGGDRYRLANMGNAHRRSIVNAVTLAVGLGEFAEVPDGH